MNNHDIVRTDNVLVRVMGLDQDASTEWHYHTEVTDYFVCLNGAIKIEVNYPDESIILHPGQRAEVKPPQVHRVLNSYPDKSEYMLVQGVGKYDFIKTDPQFTCP
jgi:quercetin dioxygenase-like cupin family protein